MQTLKKGLSPAMRTIQSFNNIIRLERFDMYLQSSNHLHIPIPGLH